MNGEHRKTSNVKRESREWSMVNGENHENVKREGRQWPMVNGESIVNDEFKNRGSIQGGNMMVGLAGCRMGVYVPAFLSRFTFDVSRCFPNFHHSPFIHH